jgi:murein DD-endopeptidase MepM/ murein hydrolase activator NlpD
MTAEKEKKKPMSRKKARAIRVTIIVGVIVAGGFMLVAIPQLLGYDIFFNNGGRYDASALNTMGVIYPDRANITAFNEGYSESSSCPWGFVHNGIDYFLANGSDVLAAAHGQVKEVSWRDNGEGVANRFYVRINFQFNATVVLGYNFEPWTSMATDKDHQLALINVKQGDWVVKGQVIGKFLSIFQGHIHFDVIEKNARHCPSRYFGTSDLAEITGMIHDHQPSWNLCYP